MSYAARQLREHQLLHCNSGSDWPFAPPLSTPIGVQAEMRHRPLDPRVSIAHAANVCLLTADEFYKGCSMRHLKSRSYFARRQGRAFDAVGE
jgi:hypothetical protein